MKFGLICEFRNPEQWKRPQTEVYDDIFEHVCAAEELGFGAVEALEHHFVEDGYIPSPLVVLSALAAKTKKMRLVTDVALLPLYDPVRFAEDTAVLDIISHGRLDVGVSIGYRLAEFAGYRVDLKTRGRRMNESVQIVKRLWSGEAVSFEGDFYKLDKVKISPLPVQKPTPPLWIGGFQPPAVRRSAKYGDGYTGVWGGDASVQTYKMLQDEMRLAGRDPATARMRLCKAGFLVISKDPEKTFIEMAPYVTYWANTYSSFFEGSDTQLWPKITDNEVLRATDLLTVLTPDQAITFLKDMSAMVPVDTFAMEMTPPGLPAAKSFKYLELFAKEVMPAFR